MLLRVSTMVLALAMPFFHAGAESSSELIFAVGSAPFASSHASTIVELKDGNLLAAWFGGTEERKPDVAIWASRRDAAGWSAPFELAREPKVPCWNPVLFHSGDGRLWFYYKFGPNTSEWQAARKFSLDEGRSWSTVEYLPAGILGPIRAKPLVLPNGVIVSGTSFEAWRSWTIWVERSTDDGRRWTKIGPILPTTAVGHAAGEDKTSGLIQPSIVNLKDGHLRLYARSTSDIGRICIADSKDNGLAWSAARPLELPNPNSGIDALALTDGRVVLVYNNSTTSRTPLNMAVSSDGEHFRNFKTLEDRPGEYSYPALIQDGNGDLDVTYTWNRKSIKHVHISISEIPK